MNLKEVVYNLIISQYINKAKERSPYKDHKEKLLAFNFFRH